MGMQAAPAQLFYDFCLDDHVPEDHLLRRIDRFLDLEKVCTELKPFYSSIGRPSIDPELMMRMLIVGYCMGIRSERQLCEEIHLNLAYRWFCNLGLDGRVPDDSTFSRNRHGRFRQSDILRHLFETVVERCLRTMIDRTARRFGITPRHLVADSAYGSAANLAWLVKERQIEPHIPVFDKSNRTDGTFSRSDFVFDAERNHYTCPEGTAAGAVPADIRDAALGHHQGRDAVIPLKQV